MFGQNLLAISQFQKTKQRGGAGLYINLMHFEEHLEADSHDEDTRSYTSESCQLCVELFLFCSVAFPLLVLVSTPALTHRSFFNVMVNISPTYMNFNVINSLIKLKLTQLSLTLHLPFVQNGFGGDALNNQPLSTAPWYDALFLKTFRSVPT